MSKDQEPQLREERLTVISANLNSGLSMEGQSPNGTQHTAEIRIGPEHREGEDRLLLQAWKGLLSLSSGLVTFQMGPLGVPQSPPSTYSQSASPGAQPQRGPLSRSCWLEPIESPCAVVRECCLCIISGTHSVTATDSYLCCLYWIFAPAS